VATTLTDPSEGRADAIAFLVDASQGVKTAAGKGLPHAQAVADILRDAGYDQRVQVVALLHDVVEDTSRSIEHVRDGFGETIAATVAALTEDDSIHNYAQRKRGLRAQVIGAGTEVMAIALADKIATLEHARITATRVRRRKLAHYEATLQSRSPPGRPRALPPRRRTPRRSGLMAHTADAAAAWRSAITPGRGQASWNTRSSGAT
jgi:(p)ppGpp synthase/HD superfamily hydrolase